MISNTIIIHGPGRSGTTLLNKILSFHPDVFFLSNYNNRFPNTSLPFYLNNLGQTIQGLDWLKNIRDSPWVPRSTEAYHYWDSFYDQKISNGDIFESDIPNKRLFNQIEKGRRITKKENFLIKLTGTARPNFIRNNFDSPKVIWIDRDPRAIVSSYIKQQWRFRNKKAQWEKMSWEEKAEYYITLYKSHFHEREFLKEMDIQFVKYEDLVENPIAFCSSLFQFTGFKTSPVFERRLALTEIRKGNNQTWRKHYSTEQIQYLEDKLSFEIKSLGYE